jgi:hypothetical protein
VEGKFPPIRVRFSIDSDGNATEDLVVVSWAGSAPSAWPWLALLERIYTERNGQ